MWALLSRRTLRGPCVAQNRLYGRAQHTGCGGASAQPHTRARHVSLPTATARSQSKPHQIPWTKCSPHRPRLRIVMTCGRGRGVVPGRMRASAMPRGLARPPAVSLRACTTYAGSCTVCEDGVTRCWGHDDDDLRVYHDHAWGRPITCPRELFGKLTLDSFQAGLSWTIILRKAENFRRAFAGWDFVRVAAFTEEDYERLMGDASIVRNRLKIRAAINNANIVCGLEDTYPGGFVAWVYDSTGIVPSSERYIQTHRSGHMRSDFSTKARDRTDADGVHPTASAAAFTVAAKRAGFKFLGETSCFSFLQAVGVYNHHHTDCFAFAQCEEAKLQADNVLGRGRHTASH